MIELNKIYNENCLETMRKMPDGFVDCVITSPPYWQLRDYEIEGQWGLEPTYREYLQNLWNMMDEIWRILKEDGTVWINLGDTYNTLSGNIKSGMKNKQINTNMVSGINIGSYFKAKDIKNKCLLLIPHRFAIGCIERGWLLRNDIIWAKRNAMPESVTDRFSKKHEYFFFMVKQPKYYFDLDGIRDKHIWADSDYRSKIKGGVKNKTGLSVNGQYAISGTAYNEIGKNPGDVADFWDIPTQPNRDKHFASYNPDLIKKPILAGCREGGLIYDPFMGTGTTAHAALNAGRNYIGSELNPDYVNMAERRLQPIKAQLNLFK